MPVHHLTTTRTARYFTAGAEGTDIRRLWLLLHGHAMLAERFLELMAPLAGPGTLLVAPEALSRFYLGTRLNGQHDPQIGATWMTREDRDAEVADAIDYLDGLMRVVRPPRYPPVPVGVLGFSQGVAVACRWVARGTTRPAALVLWGAPPPGDVEPATLAEGLAGAPVRLVAGSTDPILPEAISNAARERLTGAGIAVTLEQFAGGHVLHSATLRTVADDFSSRTP